MGGNQSKSVGPTTSKLVKGVKYDDDGNVSNCIFCDIASKKEVPNVNKKSRPEEQLLQGKILYEDGTCVVFCNRTVHARFQLLAVPKLHYKNVLTLTKEDISLLEHLRSCGEKTLKDMIHCDKNLAGSPKEDDFIFCFHVPPFNSIDHLHLHCIAPPFNDWSGSIKYSPGRMKPWVVTVSDVVGLLKAKM
jgi:diadenosine tetraphosphate (Ap4A) HIT family hydrolase